jgi:hypothetical protein
MSSSDYSILAMLQRRMARAAARREPFPRDTEEFGGRVIEWLDRHLFDVREGSHAGALAR